MRRGRAASPHSHTHLMESLFKILFNLLGGLYGQPLSQYLAGNTGAPGGSQYALYGLVALGVSAALAVLFYYVANSPRLARRWAWLTTLAASSVVNLLFGWLHTLADLKSGLMAVTDPVTGAAATQVTRTNCLGFGLAEAVWAAVFFLLISMAIKWWSPMACRTPF